MRELLFRKLTGIPGQDVYRLEPHSGIKKGYRMFVQVDGRDWCIIPTKAAYKKFEDLTPTGLEALKEYQNGK